MGAREGIGKERKTAETGGDLYRGQLGCYFMNKYKEIWKARKVRLSDELWYELMKQAKLQGISTAEFIRNIIRKELE